MGLQAATIALVALGGATALHAQVAIHVTAGARYSGALVRDSIVAPFDVRPALGPAFGAGIELPPHRRWSGGARFDVSFNTLRREERGSTADLGGLTVLSLIVHLRRELAPGLGGQLTAGGLRYVAGERAGLFNGGAEVFPVVGLAADWTPAALRPRGLAVEARSDVHPFLTQAMRAQGFSSHRFVPRFSLSLRADVRKLW